ncbi:MULTISPECIES: GNAT family N-acetyltransferase [Nocardioides]|uniref:GNAT family N-acetyltransferase n=1 Tax=Nocardioides vastitatis TaxID=2568655 RepID=A0ABW0ZMP4_9ACTN|nr:GNAT family N-acetyltransferase [Nocardioides sp.]THI92530.1 GNAT family N-acetyltransferase [Nocardioides sp.]
MDDSTRIATSPEDFETAARLLVAFNTEYDEPAPEPDWWATHLARLSAEGTARVVLAGRPGDGVGVVRLRTSTYSEDLEAYLAELYVAPPLRGQGIGTVLLQAIIEDARAQGATYMDLTTTEDDVAARAIYRRFGFDRNEGRGAEGALSYYYEKDL